MIRQVEEDIRTYGIIERGDRITVGLSGGADSVCLLFLLLDLQKRYALTVTAVHVHHGLRGASADADEAFVRALCARLSVPLTVYHADVRAQAKSWGFSEEETGRRLRYALLQEAAAGGKIATAHHADDNAETVLYNILRGTGLAGLAGIPQINGNVIRPLLHVTRAQIEAELAARGERWCTDETNLTGDYTRNRIRNDLLPLAEQAVNAGARAHLNALARQAAEAADLIRTLAQDWLAVHADFAETAATLPLADFAALAPPVKKRVLQLCVVRLAGHARDVTAVQLEAAAALPGKRVGAAVDLPWGLSVRRGYDRLRIGTAEEAGEPVFSAEFRFFDRPEGVLPPRNPYTKWFDYDKIKDTLTWRARRQGDTIAIAGGRKKTLARFMIDEKIPKALRARLPVLADGDAIVWVAGGRISETYKISAETARVVAVTFRPGTKRSETDE